MPVTTNSGAHGTNSTEILYQRQQYGKGGVGRWYWDLRDEALFREIPEAAVAILDAGCGEGITLENLCGRVRDRSIQGIDLNEENVEICRRHSLPVSRGDLARLEIPDASIDCCILAEVIEHIVCYEDVLRELKRILKTGARLIMVFPNDRVFRIARLATLMLKEAFYDPGHVRQWTPTAMRNALEKLGFKVVKTKCIPFRFWPLSLHCIMVAVKR